jgi:hypothetical protein
VETYPATVFNHLDREWERLLASRQLDLALTRWRATGNHLDDFEQVGQLLGLLEDRDADPERQSEILLALLRQAPHDRLAARLILQRFVPALKSIAGWDQPMRQTDWAAMVVSAAHEVIVTYPVDRRPSRVAANIVWDVRKRMYASLAEHRRWQDELSAASESDDRALEPDVAESFEAVDLLRWAATRSRLPRDVAELIVLTRSAGFQLEELAAGCGVPSSRLRQRRWRSEQRMREALATAI